LTNIEGPVESSLDQALQAPADGPSIFHDNKTSNAPEISAYISVESFLRRRVRPSIHHEEPRIGVEKLAVLSTRRTGYGFGHVEEGSPLISAAPKFSPIEFEVSPLRPKSAVDWAFDIKVPNSTGTLLEQSDYDELQSDRDSLPGVAVLDCHSEAEESGSPSSQRGKDTLRLRSRNVRRQWIMDDLEHSEAYSSDSGSERTGPQTRAPHPKRAKKKVKLKSLGSRLFEACVATHGNPMDSLVVPHLNQTNSTEALTRDGEVHAQRNPLPFNPIDMSNKTPGYGLSTASKGHILVDPRRSEPFRTARFGPPMKIRRQSASQEGDPAIRSPPIVYKALSNWKPKLDENYFQETPSQKPIRGRGKRGRRKEGKNTPEIAYPPLEFVPLSEAQLNRKNRNGHRVPLGNRRA
jgi:hypothetical protein